MQGWIWSDSVGLTAASVVQPSSPARSLDPSLRSKADQHPKRKTSTKKSAVARSQLLHDCIEAAKAGPSLPHPIILFSAAYEIPRFAQHVLIGDFPQ